MRAERESSKGLFIRKERAVDEAVQRAVQHALLTHKRAGHSVASWEGGKVVDIPAERIPVGKSSNGKRK